VDVLIADIDMPGMKGTDLAQQATERWPNLRVLLVSGGAADARGFTVLQRSGKVKERDVTTGLC
jgi:DNA-binding NarL/FixJ family response regulator